MRLTKFKISIVLSSFLTIDQVICNFLPIVMSLFLPPLVHLWGVSVPYVIDAYISTRVQRSRINDGVTNSSSDRSQQFSSNVETISHLKVPR
jgi:hypothetical protein